MCEEERKAAKKKLPEATKLELKASVMRVEVTQCMETEVPAIQPEVSRKASK